MREHADNDRLAEIEQLLTPPTTYRVKGVPSWYGDDDEVWEEFSGQLDK